MAGRPEQAKHTPRQQRRKDDSVSQRRRTLNGKETKNMMFEQDVIGIAVGSAPLPPPLSLSRARAPVTSQPDARSHLGRIGHTAHTLDEPGVRPVHLQGEG